MGVNGAFYRLKHDSKWITVTRITFSKWYRLRRYWGALTLTLNRHSCGAIHKFVTHEPHDAFCSYDHAIGFRPRFSDFPRDSAV